MCENPTHRHVKRGTLYRVIGRGELQTSRPIFEGEQLVAYLAEDGTLWFRPEREFNDGRFERLTDSISKS